MRMALEQVGSHCDDIPDPWYALEKRISGGDALQKTQSGQKEGENKSHFEPGNRI